MRALVLRFDAPMMSFGSTLIDDYGPTDFFPGRSMLTGLIGNALGWRHSDFELLQSLQDRIGFAARWDVYPRREIDYHTVFLGSPKMCGPGWTTRGCTEHRCNADRNGTVIRYQCYLTDGLMTVVLGVAGEDAPALDTIKGALGKPARPLFLGRKTCLPTRPLLDPVNPVMEGSDLLSILKTVPVWSQSGETVQQPEPMLACSTDGTIADSLWTSHQIYDQRDWRTQLPAGSSQRMEGKIGG